MLKKFFYRVFCGFFLGLSVFLPGISGSVIAIAMGIYQDIVRIASNPFKRLKENILFCIPLGIGVGISAVLFVISFKFLFESHEKAIYFLFIGLIAGNLPVISKEIKRCGFKIRYIFAAVGAFAAALLLVIFAPESGAASEGVSSGLPMLALSGLAGGVTALVPGMSVSTVLIVLGVYGQVIFAAEAMLHVDFAYALPLGVFGLCAVVGLVLASRGIKAMFERFPGFANSVVLGFVAGSLAGIAVLALRIEDAGFRWPVGGALLAAGLGISVLFVLLGKKMEKA